MVKFLTITFLFLIFFYSENSCFLGGGKIRAMLALGTWSGKDVQLVEASTGMERRAMPAHMGCGGVGSDCFVVRSCGRVRLRSPPRLSASNKNPPSVGRVFEVAISNDGAALATAGVDRSWKLWELSTGTVTHTVEMKDSWGECTCVVRSRRHIDIDYGCTPTTLFHPASPPPDLFPPQTRIATGPNKWSLRTAMQLRTALCVPERCLPT